MQGQGTHFLTRTHIFCAVAILLASSSHAAGDEVPAKPTEKAASRAAKLKAAIKTFSFELANFPSLRRKEFDSLTLTVGDQRDRPPRLRLRRPNERFVKISEEQAKKIIDYLAMERFLDRAEEGFITPHVHSVNEYELHIEATLDGKSIRYEGIFGWGKSLQERLKKLRSVLDGDAAKELNGLIESLRNVKP